MDLIQGKLVAVIVCQTILGGATRATISDIQGQATGLRLVTWRF